MDKSATSHEVKLQLLKVVGTGLDHLYALVSVEKDLDEGLARVCEWDGGSWRCIYRDATDFSTDCLLMPDGTLLLARPDGHLVVLAGATPRILNSHQAGGFGLGAISPTEVLMVGSRLSVLDMRTESETDLSTLTLHSGVLSVGSEWVFIVGRKGEFGQISIKDRKLKLLHSGTEQNLSAVTQYQDGTPVVGGWHGVVQRRRGNTWEDLSLSHDKLVTDLALRGTTLLSCSGGVYALDEASRTWRCEIEPTEGVWNLSPVHGHLLACHTYRGLISLWTNSTWQVAFPPCLPQATCSDSSRPRANRPAYTP